MEHTPILTQRSAFCIIAARFLLVSDTSHERHLSRAR